MIEIVDYRESWPAECAVLGTRLRETLGGVAHAIHHIGSTSVPGLAAKDVIDIQVTIADLAAPIDAALAQAGFVPGAPLVDHCPPGMTLAPAELAKRLFDFTARRANLHVRAVGRFNQRYLLLCHDYLRTVPGVAAAYGAIKRQLARHFPDDVAAYYDIKDPVFDVMMAGAREWARATAWKPPPTDA